MLNPPEVMESYTCTKHRKPRNVISVEKQSSQQDFMCDSLLWVETLLDSKHACETDCVLLGASGGIGVWKKYLLNH